MAVACSKSHGVNKAPLSVANTQWLSDNTGGLTTRSDFFVIDFASNTLLLREAKRGNGSWTYISREYDGNAWYIGGKGSFSQSKESISFSITISGADIYGLPLLGQHSLSLKTGTISGSANTTMSVAYEATDKDGNTKNGTLTFHRESK